MVEGIELDLDSPEEFCEACVKPNQHSSLILMNHQPELKIMASTFTGIYGVK